ncbi:riboflavin kinase / FMN adenylyltransferase [bacterium A37T11]|nr:riboflavin kinase / FMN adenylyltransferase [bacterium A37T11]
MKIYRNLQEFIPLDTAVVTIGTFDGVHIGHQKIISTLKKCANELGGETVLLTFFPHPRMILHPEDDSLRLISDLSEKIELLAASGIDHLIITPFTRDFSNLTPEAYIRDILVGKIGTKKMVIGYDHRFGKDREGSMRDLLKFSAIYGYAVQEIPEQDINDVAVSSSKIREALVNGDIATANTYLGYPFELTGTIVRGEQLGRGLGFPTANMQVDEPYKLIPGFGIYAVEAAILAPSNHSDDVFSPPEVLKTLYGMNYIGNRPTIDGLNFSIETHLFDFDEDLYGKRMRIKFLHFVRSDQKFDSVEAMVAQISIDEKNIRSLIFR